MMHSSEERAAIVADLERRIDELDDLDEAEFGRFTRVDWALCILGALVVPYVAYLWFW